MRSPVFPATMAEGEMMAIFPDGYSAGQFFQRMTDNPAAEYATDVRRNRRGGKVVTWKLDIAAFREAGLRRRVPEAELSVARYTADMRETVGYYGTTPAGWCGLHGRRTPDGSTSGKVAWLNGRPCPPEF
jgi:hypothetical protein